MLFNETNFIENVFSSKLSNFNELAISLFHHQYNHNPVYQNYCQHLRIDPLSIKNVESIPFLPIGFFKSHQVITGNFEPEVIYSSSSTTGKGQSHHYVKNNVIYEKSCNTSFELFYGKIEQFVILALLPSYLERSGSSLVAMAEKWISLSSFKESGFYLDNFEALNQTIQRLQEENKPTLLLGVTFALLDFANAFPLALRNLIVMETGGMKGKRKEMVRAEVHEQLKHQWGLSNIHSEYGMTELLSQAYSKGEGVFNCPPWMKVFITDTNDFGTQLPQGKTGIINVIDLANIHSCAFIQTEDLGRINEQGGFEVMGRMDQSDIRGCSLMYV